METVDVAVIGGGVLGCAVARELSLYQLDVVLLEASGDVGEGASKANSGIVHAGFHPRGGSLKGRSCVDGNALLRRLVQDLDVPFSACGGMMVAFNEAGVDKLREKAARALENGAGVLPIVDGEHTRSIEPRLSPLVVAALIAPTTAVVSPFELTLALARSATGNGVRFRFGSKVVRVERARIPRKSSYLLHLEDGEVLCARYVANMAGDDAAIIDTQVHPADLIVRPRLGEYLVFDKQDPATAITHVIYQAAETDEGGTLIAPTVDGNLLAGPTSRNVRGFHENASSPEGLGHIRTVARKLVPDLELGAVIANFAGTRANIVNVVKEQKDFVVRVSAEGFVSALGIKNPGLTSSPALAKLAVSLLRDEGLRLVPDPTAVLVQKNRRPFLERTSQEQERLLADDPSYGHVICRCEAVTEGDVRAILRGPLPPQTLDGLKRRLRTGMGRCQGAFCMPRIVSIVSDELGVPEDAILKGSQGGRLVLRRVK